MNKVTVERIIDQAVKNIFQNQSNIDEFTFETRQTEWNLAHHLAVEIHNLLPWFDYDLDITKPNYDNKRPDNVLHKRGNHDSNFLVIEVKKDGSGTAIDEDIQQDQKPLKTASKVAHSIARNRTYGKNPIHPGDMGSVIILRSACHLSFSNG